MNEYIREMCNEEKMLTYGSESDKVVSSGIHLFCTPRPSDDVITNGCEKGMVMVNIVSIVGSAVNMGSRSTSLS